MERGLHNITSATTTTLLSKGEDAGFLSSIRITNAHETRAIFIGLYLDDGTNQTYFFKKHYDTILLKPFIFSYLNTFSNLSSIPCL